ncbi:MAG: glycoside hydrolase family 43 protein [Candidatus Methylacidiphilales bacterium]|nr:glycoside hydrolase family 43 protein [Candidatus Methylacidiphilales bacterium]
MNEATFKNPVLPGFYPDPSICRVGGDFYLVNSSFEFFPALPLHHSTNLVDWRPIGHALDRGSQIDLSRTPTSQGLFAPTIRFHGGRFYLVCTDVSGIGNFIIQAERAEGPWSDPLPIAIEGIDPSLFFYRGEAWLTVSAPDQQGIWLARLDVESGCLLDAPSLVWKGTGGKYPEGPHLFLRDGWFYLLISEGGTEYGHMITVARSRDILGPYEPCSRNPIGSHRSLDHPLQATGHADWVELESGDWWMVFLAIRPLGYPPMHHLGRETCLAPVHWDGDGWPVVPLPLPMRLPVPFAHSTTAVVEGIRFRDEFDEPFPDPGWIHRRTPRQDAWSLVRTPGSLSLRCAPPCLDDPEPLAFLGRRIRDHSFRAATLLDFKPADTGDRAGLVVHYNERHWSALEMGIGAAGRGVRFARRCGSLRAESEWHALPEGPVELAVSAGWDGSDKAYWRFEVRLPEGWKELGASEVRHQSTELAGGFIGNLTALYATGSGRDSSTWAEFAWFEEIANPTIETL